jgi:uncharacterized protein (DUF488 family)
MYYRRKILLALLEGFEREVGNINVQKLSFLISRSQETKPCFDFVPHKYGCYSYQIAWDLKALTTYGFLSETQNGWRLEKRNKYLSQLVLKDQEIVKHIIKQFKNYSADELMRYTYLHYPYYAINSIRAEAILTAEEYAKIEIQKSTGGQKFLFSIGYEGISLEKYFNKLLLNNVKVLCDVRKNAFSQKIGFSKGVLKNVCNALGILYIHIPELGIESDKRQNLKTQKDYDMLFADYENNHLIYQGEYITQILSLIETHQRIAVTCFEANHCQCHRSKVVIAATQHPNWNYSHQHL